MKIRAILAGLALAIATLAYASTHPRTVHQAGIPIPLCPPDQPSCSLNQ